jgi:hypothetical protein
MDMLKRVFGSKKKRSISDEVGFERLQTSEMDAILGGRPTGQVADSFEVNPSLTDPTTSRTDYTTGKIHS